MQILEDTYHMHPPSLTKYNVWIEYVYKLLISLYCQDPFSKSGMSLHKGTMTFAILLTGFMSVQKETLLILETFFHNLMNNILWDCFLGKSQASASIHMQTIYHHIYPIFPTRNYIFHYYHDEPCLCSALISSTFYSRTCSLKWHTNISSKHVHQLR